MPVDAIADLPWRIYPALAIVAVGLAVFVLGIRIEVDGIRRHTGDPTKMVTVIRGFRVAVIGLALGGLGAAWNWQIMWLFVLSLIFGIEEILESSVHLFILRHRPPHWPSRSRT